MKTFRININWALALAVVVLAMGCASTEPHVVATWKGTIIGTERVNEKVDLTTPQLHATQWNPKGDALVVELTQQRTTTFDLEQRDQTLRAMRSEYVINSGDDIWGITPAGTANMLLFIFTWGVYPCAVTIPPMIVYDFKLDAMERAAIAELKNGEPSAQVNQHRWYLVVGGYKTDITRTYSREVVSEEITRIPSQPNVITVPAVAIEVKAVPAGDHHRETTAITDDQGAATVKLDASITSQELQLFVLWENIWHDLGTVKALSE